MNNQRQVQYKESYSGKVYRYTMEDLVSSEFYQVDVYYGYCDINSDGCKELIIKVDGWKEGGYLIKYEDKKLEVFNEIFFYEGSTDISYYDNGMCAWYNSWLAESKIGFEWEVDIIDFKGNRKEIYSKEEYIDEASFDTYMKDSDEKLANLVEQVIKDKGLDPNTKKVELIAWQE